MSARGPGVETRRKPEFADELAARARAWIPDWELNGDTPDFGRALLEIAARIQSEVAERLDRMAEKNARGFLDWLGIQGAAARAARMPVVLRLTESAPAPVLARAPVQLQADAGGKAVVFETETDVQLVAGKLAAIVAVDPGGDAFYLPAPGLADLGPASPLPSQWRLRSFAAPGAAQLQLDPELGLAPGIILAIEGQQYRITTVNRDIVGIDPPLAAGEGIEANTVAAKVSSFAPFDGAARNRQEHALYLGHQDALDIEAPASISIAGVGALPAAVTWQYWGKAEGSKESGWQALTRLPASAPGDALMLSKGKGAVEPTEVGGVQSRWVRAVIGGVGGPTPPQDTIALRINCGKQTDACPFEDYDPASAPAIDGVANTTPLVLNDVFYPLGQEPRQFDAFYLACQEAFSKANAQVDLCFEFANSALGPLAVAKAGRGGGSVLAGVGRSGLLYLLALDPASGTLSALHGRGPLQPPGPQDGGDAAQQPNLRLDRRPPWRPAAWTMGSDLFVAVPAGADVWLWHENYADPRKSGWKALGTVPARTAARPVDGIVLLGADDQARLVALRDGQLFSSPLDAPMWTPWPAADGAAGVDAPIGWAAIVPVRSPGSGSAVAQGLVGVSFQQRLYGIGEDGQAHRLETPRVACGVRPVAVRLDNGELVVVTANADKDALVAFRSKAGGSFGKADGASIGLGKAAFAGSSLDGRAGSDGSFVAMALVREGGSTRLVSWLPFDEDANGILFEAQAAAGAGVFDEAPVIANNYVVVPGARPDALVAKLNSANRMALAFDPATDLPDALLVVASHAPFAAGDVVARGAEFHQISASVAVGGDQTLYPVDQPFKGDAQVWQFYHRSLDGSEATVLSARTLKLTNPDPELATDAVLFVSYGKDKEGLFEVAAIDRHVDPWVVTVKRSFDDGIGGHASYWRPEHVSARRVAVLSLHPGTALDSVGALLADAMLYFPGAEPPRQRPVLWMSNAAAGLLWIVLGAQWARRPDAGLRAAMLDATVSAWSSQLGNPSASAELSWEYWNGTGWWKLDDVADGTANLQKQGTVSFRVPSDLAPTDWAGKTGHWIRARLVEGDYGRERVVVRPIENVEGKGGQTIDRFTDEIHPPLVVQLQLRYRLCDDVLPTWVLAQDSGMIRDQSDANRTPGATVESFVPLAVTLARLETGTGAGSPQGEACLPDCDCGAIRPPSAQSRQGNPAPPPANGAAPGRALYLGFDANLLQGEPINLLFLAGTEHDHDAFTPLRVDVLRGARMEPLVASDATRGLGESGLVSVALPEAPPAAGLFGQALRWLRLRPAAGSDDGGWQPDLRGAYLNAVWAQAAETQEFEMLGSSKGAPGQVVFLARPPVLQDTLELRVREPLGEEERASLLQDDPASVRSDVPGQPGDWVRWRQVVDPADSGPADRVYALDEASGQIRFGDGEHGAIVPIGRDAIMAFRYRRTEAGPAGGVSAPANAVAAGASLNVVTPVESVEAAFAADQAAGGADAEDVTRVLRFGPSRVRHRGRVVTARDLEDMALQMLPDLAQARCLRSGQSVRLIAVMRGSQPLSSRAVKRELARALLAAAPPQLAARNGLAVADPVLVPFHVRVVLVTSSLDYSGRLAQQAGSAIRAFFDTARGGIDGSGWPLGAAPRSADIAACLLDIPHLDGIAAVGLAETSAAGKPQPLRAALREDELAWLGADGITLEFQLREALA